MNSIQEAQLNTLLGTIESVRGFKPECTLSETPANVAFTKGVEHFAGTIYVRIAAMADGSNGRLPPVGRFPPIAISPRREKSGAKLGAVTMPSIKSYRRRQLASGGLPDVGGSEAFACAVFADHWLRKQISGERWSHSAPRTSGGRARSITGDVKKKRGHE